MNIDVTTLSAPELKALLAAAERRLQLITSRPPVAGVRRQLVALARAAGYTIQEVFDATPPAAAKGRKPSRRKLGKVAPKYRDPDNKRNTWSGRGRMPIWLVEKTKRGRSAADFLIPGLARPTARKGAPIGQRTVFKQG